MRNGPGRELDSRRRRNMPLSLHQLLHGLRQLAAGLAAGCVCQSQAGAAPNEAHWEDRGDAAFHKAIDTSMVVNALAQDGRGFLWLGSQAGLMRWDGY